MEEKNRPTLIEELPEKSRDYFSKRRFDKKANQRFFFLNKKVGQAVTDYKMLEENDKVLVAVSGGKDSLSLLNLLEYRRRVLPYKFSLLAVYIDSGLNSGLAPKLKQYFEENNFEYIIEEIDLKKDQDNKKGMNCFWCSWNRRKALFQLVRKHNCTKLALGHHKDDIIETFLLNLFFQANISTMSPLQELFGGEVKIIRPLAYVQEKETKDLAKYLKLETVDCQCPNSNLNNRKKIKAIIEEMRKVCPAVKNNIFNSLRNIKYDYLL